MPTPTPQDLDFVIHVMYPAASAAYLIMSLPQPPLLLPQGFTLVGPIMADPVRAAHVMAQAPPDQQRIPNGMVSESSIFGLVAWNAATRTALVAIRGTKTIWDWLGDFDAAPVAWFADSGAGLVHMGFQLVYEHICASLRDLLHTGCPGVQRILVTGHSLGGAVAVLAGYDILKQAGFGVTPEVYTFAGPRTGAPDFVGHLNGGIPVCCRVVNFMDVVPQVPVPPLYQHPGQEIVVHGGFRPLDVTYAHHLTTYLNGLQQLRQASPAPAAPEVPAAAQALEAVGATP
ncbi:MAG TPA: lipase family protein [Acidobacteriaceae bacterium]